MLAVWRAAIYGLPLNAPNGQLGLLNHNRLNMSFSQAEILLGKIIALHKGMRLDDESVSTIERDLMLDHLRKLYDIYLDISVEKGKKIAAAAPPPPPEVVNRPPVPPPPPPAPPVVVPPAPPVVNIPPRPTTPPPPPAPQPRPAAQPTATPRPAGIFSIPTPLAPLFEYRPSRELADKLGDQRVEDLSRALTINERQLYAHELFGKDHQGMLEVIGKLNQMRELDDALQLLVSLANRYNWVEEERMDIAKDFIRLVRRKF